jgi:hypothetical protein
MATAGLDPHPAITNPITSATLISHKQFLFFFMFYPPIGKTGSMRSIEPVSIFKKSGATQAVCPAAAPQVPRRKGVYAFTGGDFRLLFI